MEANASVARRRAPSLLIATPLLGTLLILTLMLGVLGVSSSSASAAIPANFFTVSDAQGPNDEPGQKDLTRFGRDDSDPTSYKIFWSWDEIDQWSGAGQTGDACALFDTDGDSFINFVVCGQVYNPSAGSVVETPGSPYAFSCNNAKTDNCGGPVGPLSSTAADIKTGAITPGGDPLPSPPADLATNTDPFILGSDTPFDTTLEMFILKSYLPPNAVLVNVCSFPSIGGGFNNDPSDCIVNPGGGFLRINKVAPAGTTQAFSFGVNPGASTHTITGSGQTSAIALPIAPPGTLASVAETVPGGWILDSATCTLENGLPTGVRRTNTISAITIQSGRVTDCTFTNVRPPALNLTKTADAAAVSAGAAIGFTLGVTNSGLGPAQGVQVTDTLPTDAGLRWSVDGGSVAGTCSIATGVLTCNVGTLAAGATATVHITSSTTPATCGDVDNTGSVTSTNGGSPAPAHSAVTVRCPDLDLTKQADDGSVSAGDQIGFTISVTNSGNGTATGVTISDLLPAGSGISWTLDAAGSDAGCSITSGTLSCSFGSLAPGASKHVHVVSPTTAASCDTYENTAAADATNDDEVQAQASTTVNCGDIALSKVADAATVSAGDRIGFVVTATNHGSGEARNVTVTDSLSTAAGLNWSIAAGSAAGCSIAGATLTCTWGTLGSNASKSVHITSPTTMASCATIPNRAAVSTSNDGSAEASASTIVKCGAIAIDKTGAATAQAGQPVLYTLEVTNPGEVPFLAPNVNVADALCDAPPLLLTKNADTSPGQLNPGDRWTYTCTVQTQVGQTVVENVGIVAATDSNGNVVRDDDPATTQLTQPPPPTVSPVPVEPSGVPVKPAAQVKPVAAVIPTATARLTGPKRCVFGPFDVKVSGRGIARVMFLLDGKKLKTVVGSADRTVFKVRINSRRESGFAHRITAKVTFKTATRTRARTLRFIYLGCPRKIAAPQFTG